jgi:hypothetical protein
VKSVWVDCQYGYSEEDIHNADETGMSYITTPDSIFKIKGESVLA